MREVMAEMLSILRDIRDRLPQPNGEPKPKQMKIGGLNAPTDHDWEHADALRKLLIEHAPAHPIRNKGEWSRIKYQWAKSFAAARRRGVDCARVIEAAEYGLTHPTHPVAITRPVEAIDKAPRLLMRKENERKEQRQQTMDLQLERAKHEARSALRRAEAKLAEAEAELRTNPQDDYAQRQRAARSEAVCRAEAKLSRLVGS